MEAVETRNTEAATDLSRNHAKEQGTSSPKILFLIDEMSAITAGGTERQLLQLVEIAQRSGLSPQICVLRGTEWLTSQVAGCGVKHFQIGTICSRSGLTALKDLLGWIRQEKFQILQAFFSESNLLGPWAGRMAGVPIILGTRRNLNHAMKDGPNRLGLRMQWVSNLLVNQIIANSEAVLERVAESEWGSRRKLCVVYNGIDPTQMQPKPGSRAKLRRELGLADNEILVGNVSGLRRIKGVDLFVEAAALAYRRHPSLRFVLVGDGELREEIESLVQARGLTAAFRIAGAADDVRPYLAAMDVAVLCSMAEGFSNSLLEYMAAELPIVATDVGGNREALGGCGILIEPGKPDDLANAIGSMVDGDSRRKFASGGLLAVQRFDVKIAEARMSEIYWSHLGRAFLGNGRALGRDVQNIAQMPVAGSLSKDNPDQSALGEP